MSQSLEQLSLLDSPADLVAGSEGGSLRQAAAVGLAEGAVLMVRGTALLLLASPFLIAAYLLLG